MWRERSELKSFSPQVNWITGNGWRKMIAGESIANEVGVFAGEGNFRYTTDWINSVEKDNCYYTIGAGPCYAGVVVNRSGYLRVFHLLVPDCEGKNSQKFLGNPNDVVGGIVGSSTSSMADKIARKLTHMYRLNPITPTDDPYYRQTPNQSFNIMVARGVATVSYNYF